MPVIDLAVWFSAADAAHAAHIPTHPRWLRPYPFAMGALFGRPAVVGTWYSLDADARHYFTVNRVGTVAYLGVTPDPAGAPS